MTVSSETAKSGPYTGNGVTTVFAYGFRILDASHIEVIRTVAGTASTVSPSEYTVSGVGDLAGGNVTFTVAPASGQTITIVRNAPFTQQTDLENQGAYYAEVVEEALDLAAMRDQQLQEQINRSVKIPVGQNEAVLDTLIEDIIRLSDSADEIDTVAWIEANVVTVAGIADNVTTVSGIAANVTTVATDIAAVNTVAADLNEPVSEIETVAGSIANVNTVGGSISAVNTVAGIADNVTTVAGISGNVITVAGNSANVSTVAGISGNVTTVAGIEGDVTTVAGIASDVSTVAANVTDITNFSDVYQGPKAANPTQRNDATALQAGDLYFNTVVDQMRVYDGAAWVAASSAVNGTTKRQVFTATAGQTTFSITDGYDAGFIDVYLNGAKLVNGDDVIVTSGTDVVLTTGATLGDSVDVVAYGAFELANTYTKAEADTLLAAKAPTASPTFTGTITAPAVRSASYNDASGGNTATINGIPLRPGVLDPENRIINGAFDFWQRGTSQTTNGYGSADRWGNGAGGGTVTMSRQSFTLGDTLGSNSPTYFLRQTVSGQTLSSELALIEQRIESVRSYAGQTITVLGWARRSSGTGNMVVELEQNFGTGGSPSSPVTTISPTTVTLSGSWQPFAVVASVPSITGKALGTNGNDFLRLMLWTSAGSDYNARTNSLGLQTIGVDLWGIHIKVGTHTADATSLYRAPDVGTELARCQRYFQQLGAGAMGMEESATTAYMAIKCHNEMRKQPTLALRSTSLSVRVAAVDRDMGPVSIASASSISTLGGWLYLNIAGGGAGRVIAERFGVSFLTADAEL